MVAGTPYCLACHFQREKHDFCWNSMMPLARISTPVDHCKHDINRDPAAYDLGGLYQKYGHADTVIFSTELRTGTQLKQSERIKRS